MSIDPKILKENKLLLQGYKAKENARQDGVLICTNAAKKEFEFVKIRDIPYSEEMTIGEYLDFLENIVSANYEETLEVIKALESKYDQALSALAEYLDKEKFL